MKLLAICDYTSATGFGLVAENILGNLAPDWDIAVIGINYRGDPHPLQRKHRIYMTGQDVYGFGRLQEIIAKEQPDRIWILNDIWLTAEYVIRIRKFAPQIPIVVYTPIDSENIMRDFTKPHEGQVTLVTYTNWGAEQIKVSGYNDPIHVIGHGVNLTHFQPMSRLEARKVSYAGTPLASKDPFVVLYSGRNQPRKRIDLWIFTIAEWLKKYPHDDVFMHYHGATQDLGWNVENLADYYGVANRLILTAKNLDPGVGIPIDKLKYVYNSADLYFHACAVAG